MNSLTPRGGTSCIEAMPLIIRRVLASTPRVGALVVVLVLAVPARADSITTRVFRGVHYTVRSETTPRPVTMHIVTINLHKDGIRFRVTEPGGALDTVRETTLDFLNREHAQVAINCH